MYVIVGSKHGLIIFVKNQMPDNDNISDIWRGTPGPGITYGTYAGVLCTGFATRGSESATKGSGSSFSVGCGDKCMILHGDYRYVPYVIPGPGVIRHLYWLCINRLASESFVRTMNRNSSHGTIPEPPPPKKKNILRHSNTVFSLVRQTM